MSAGGPSSLEELIASIKGLTEVINYQIKQDKDYEQRQANTPRGGQGQGDSLTAVTNIISSFVDRMLPRQFQAVFSGVRTLSSTTSAVASGLTGGTGASVGSLLPAAGSGATGGLAALASNPIGVTIMAAVGAALAVVLTPVVLTKMFLSVKNMVADWSAELQQANRQYEGDSGGMAAVMSNREVQEFLRRQRIGEQLAGSADLLTGAEQRRKNAEERLFTSLQKLENSVVAAFEHTMAELLEAFSPLTNLVATYADEIAKWLGADDNQFGDWSVAATLRRFHDEQQERERRARQEWQALPQNQPRMPDRLPFNGQNWFGG